MAKTMMTKEGKRATVLAQLLRLLQSLEPYDAEKVIRALALLYDIELDDG